MAPFALADLPDGPLTLVLEALPIAALKMLSAVCKNWQLDSSRTELWYGLASRLRVEMPRSKARPLRSTTDLRRTFFTACTARSAARLRSLDERAARLVRQMSLRDCLSQLRKELDRDGSPLPVDHVLDGNATLLHAACRYNNVACAELLLDRAEEAAAAAVDGKVRSGINPLLLVVDQGGFTPLLTAAWCGHLEATKLLLARGAPTGSAGVPPMTSSCGGKGPYDAITWASRKGYHEVASEIARARTSQ